MTRMVSALGALAALMLVSACAYDDYYDSNYGVSYGGYGYDPSYGYGYGYSYGDNPLYDDYYGTPLTTFGVGLGAGYYDLGPSRYQRGYLNGYGGYGGYYGNGGYYNNGAGNRPVFNGAAPRGGAAPGRVAPAPARAAPAAGPAPRDERRTQFRRGPQTP